MNINNSERVKMNKVKLRPKPIENLLIRKNLSQNWLARRIGISSAYMSQLLCGKRSLSPLMRRKFLDYFQDLCFDDLFEIKEMDR